MCDEKMLQSWAKNAINRREFSVLGGAVAVAACTPGEENETSEGTKASPSLTQSEVTFATDDGTICLLYTSPSPRDS